MADPITLMVVMSAVGTGLSAVSQYRAGQAQAAAHEYSAAIVERRSIQKEEAYRKRLTRLMGSQRALYAKAGVDISSGSPLLVLSETAAEGEEEARAIRRGGEEEAVLERFYGRQAKRAGQIGGISTFLTGIGQAGVGYYALKK